MPQRQKTQKARKRRPLPAHARGPTVLRWGNRDWTMRDKPLFMQWLKRHGVNVDDFARRHPAAFLRFNPPKIPTQPGQPSPGMLPAPPPVPAKDPATGRAPAPAPDYQIPEIGMPNTPWATPPGLFQGAVAPPPVLGTPTHNPGETPPINPNLPPEGQIPRPQEAPPGAPPPPVPTPPGGPLTANPQLAAAPLGAYTDSSYEASRAILERDTRQQYAQILRQLGFNQDGAYVPGEVETTAARQRTDLNRGLGLAGKATRQQAQGEGNLFSGYFAQNLMDTQEPFVRGLADLDISTPRQLADLRQQALAVLSDYDLQHFAMLADAAQRRAQMLMGGEA